MTPPNEGDQVETYWLSKIKRKNGNGKLQFGVLGKVIRDLLTIPNSNDDSESVFYGEKDSHRLPITVSK